MIKLARVWGNIASKPHADTGESLLQHVQLEVVVAGTFATSVGHSVSHSVEVRVVFGRRWCGSVHCVLVVCNEIESG